MSMPASAIVKVNPRLINAGGTGLELNGLILTRSRDIPSSQRVLQFTSPDDAADYFGPLSTEADMAARYFLGYDNSFKKPAVLYYGLFADEALPPWLRGGRVSARVGDFRQIAAGEITVVMGGYTAKLENMNFSAVNSYSDAALVLQAAIRSQTGGGDVWKTATVTYTSTFGAFVIAGGTPGAGNGMGHASGAMAEMMRLTQEAGAVLSDGMDAQSPAEIMEACLDYTENWVSFTTAFATGEEITLALVKWSNDSGVRFLNVLWSRDLSLTVQFGEDNIGTEIQNMSYSGAAGIYGEAAHAAFIMGMIASIDYAQEQGAITTAFKSQSGQEITVKSEVVANALMEKGFNWYGDYATANDRFIFFYPGKMFGKYLFIDTYVNAIWLNSALQLAILSLFNNVARIPYTEAGYTLVRAALKDPVTQAKRAGVIDSGVTLSEAQKAQLNREAGLNIAPILDTDGYYIQVKDPTPQIRAQRGTPVVNVWYTYGGSIHKLEMASTVII